MTKLQQLMQIMLSRPRDSWEFDEQALWEAISEELGHRKFLEDNSLPTPEKLNAFTLLKKYESKKR